METYKFVELDNGYILLQKIIIDETSYKDYKKIQN